MPSWSGALAEVVGERAGGGLKAEILQYLGHSGDGGGRGVCPVGAKPLSTTPSNS